MLLCHYHIICERSAIRLIFFNLYLLLLCYTTLHKLNFFTTDRHSWSAYDLFYISDCFFSIASVLTVFRLTFVLAFNRKIGPLVVSLCQMSMVCHTLCMYVRCQWYAIYYVRLPDVSGML